MNSITLLFYSSPFNFAFYVIVSGLKEGWAPYGQVFFGDTPAGKEEMVRKVSL
jgi:hypothetical protein